MLNQWKIILPSLAILAGLSTFGHAQTYDKSYAKSLILAGNNGTDASHTLTLLAPALTGGLTLTLPDSITAGDFLTTDANGNLGWTSASNSSVNVLFDRLTAQTLSTTGSNYLFDVQMNASGASILNGARIAAIATNGNGTVTGLAIATQAHSSSGNQTVGISFNDVGMGTTLETDLFGTDSDWSLSSFGNMVLGATSIASSGGPGTPTVSSNPETGSLSFANASSTKLTTIQAGNATAAAIYTLPTAAPTASGQVLSSQTNGTMGWTTGLSVTGNTVNMPGLTDTEVVMTDANHNLISSGSATNVPPNTFLAGPPSGSSNGQAYFRTLTAADIAAASTGSGAIGIPVNGYITANSSLNQTSSYVSTGLGFTVPAGQTWAFNFNVFARDSIPGGGGPGQQGINFELVPSGSNYVSSIAYGIFGTGDGGTTGAIHWDGQHYNALSTVSTPFVTTKQVDGEIYISGIVVNGSGGSTTLMLEWANGGNSPYCSFIYGGSYLSAGEVP